jgi:ketosteroid isomerase-like protein
MKRIATSFVSLMLLLIAVTSSPAQKKRSPAEDAIHAADQEWARVFGAKDLKASVEFCADGASFLAPNVPAAVGKDAIGKTFAAFFTLPDLKLTWHPIKIEVARSGELGYSTGVYDMSLKDGAGKTMTDRGKYVTIWKKQNGRWKVIYDIFNSDLAAPVVSPQ